MTISSRQGRMNRRLGRLLSSISIIGLMCSAPVGFHTHPFAGNMAQAAIAEDELFSDLTPMTRGELAKERGGFNISGLDISVGVSVETVVDGFVKVSTNFSVGAKGKLTHLGTDVKTYTPSGSYVPDISSIVDRATPDVGAIMDNVFGAADAATQDPNNVDKDAVAGGTTAAAVVGAAGALVQVTEAVTPGGSEAAASQPQSSVASGEALVSAVQSAASTAASTAASSKGTASGAKPSPTAKTSTPTVPVTPGVFDGEALASGSQPAADAASPNNTGITTIITSPKATASATVAEPAAVATSSQAAASKPASQVPAATTQVNIGQSSSPVTANSGSQSVELADVAGASNPSGGGTSILHQVGDGQLSVVQNSMNNITVRQSTRINLTVENFVKSHDLVRLQKSLENTARLSGISSLRR